MRVVTQLVRHKQVPSHDPHFHPFVYSLFCTFRGSVPFFASSARLARASLDPGQSEAGPWQVLQPQGMRPKM